MSGDGREAGEAGGLLRLQGSELGHVDEKDEGRRLVDPRDAAQDREAAGERFILGDPPPDLPIDGLELRVDLLQPPCCLRLQQVEGQVLLPVVSRGSVLDEGMPSPLQLPELMPRFRCRFAEFRFEQGDHAGQHQGIDGVGLGALADRFGEPPCLQWIDLDRRNAVPLR